MEIIDVLGQPCPIPVIEAKKALADQGIKEVLVKVDNIAAVQNLEKMAHGYGHHFSYAQKAKDSFEVTISKDAQSPASSATTDASAAAAAAAVDDDTVAAIAATSLAAPTTPGNPTSGLAVLIARNTLGDGAEELGKILIKGFIYSLTELSVPPKHVIFLNSGAYLTAEGANTVDDLKRLEQQGTEILTCGTCSNYYQLQDRLAVGAIIDMYGITERIASAGNTVSV